MTDSTPSSLSFMCALLSAICLSGCAINDDFGRTHQSNILASTGEIVGNVQEHTGALSRQAAFHIPLTSDEQTLRQAVAYFRKPVMATPTLRAPLKTQTFPYHQTGKSFAQSFQSRIKADRLWLRRMDRALVKVIAQDMQRYDVLTSSHDVTHNDSRYIRVRLRENRAVTQAALHAMDRRIAVYDQAIEYSRLQYPEEEVRVVIPTIAKLRADIGRFKGRHEAYIFARGQKGDYDQVYID